MTSKTTNNGPEVFSGVGSHGYNAFSDIIAPELYVNAQATHFTSHWMLPDSQLGL